MTLLVVLAVIVGGISAYYFIGTIICATLDKKLIVYKWVFTHSSIEVWYIMTAWPVLARETYKLYKKLGY